jgi:CRP/FNR family cyclic AMP-dependent transcriptional regulator
MKEFAYIHDEKHSPSPLRAVPALASFSDDQLDDVLNSSSLLQCEPGDHIIKEGSIDSRIYVLLSGELEVRVGSKKVAAITRIGEVFGELALVNHDRRLASVIASTKAVCLAVDQKFLQDIHPREEDPDFHAALYEFVARLVVRKLEATSRRLAEVEKELRLANEALAHAKAASAVEASKLKRPVKRARIGGTEADAREITGDFIRLRRRS